MAFPVATVSVFEGCRFLLYFPQQFSFSIFIMLHTFRMYRRVEWHLRLRFVVGFSWREGSAVVPSNRTGTR